MFNFNKAIGRALLTWYPKGHELHLNPHLPLGKLVGEWGELLDDYMKSIYKPDYTFEPLDELGDIWYYLRILCYQRGIARILYYQEGISSHNISGFSQEILPLYGAYIPTEFNMPSTDIDFLISTAIFHSSEAFNTLCRGDKYSVFAIDVSYTILIIILRKYNITLKELTEANWQKLKPGSERGEQWMKARK
jgi:hypothetical protein